MMRPEFKIKCVSRKSSALRTAAAAVTAAVLLFSCRPETPNDYEAFISASPERALFVLNGNAGTLSAFDPATSTVFNNILVLGDGAGSEAVPCDISSSSGRLHVLLTGQNLIESFDAGNLGLKGSIKLENGSGPIAFIEPETTELAAVCNFSADRVCLVNPYAGLLVSGYEDVFRGSAESMTNAFGDIYHRRPSGGAFLEDGASSRLYVTSVRFDGGIYLKDASGNDIEYEGHKVRAPGQFREAGLSIFEADLIGGGGLRLVKEIDLEALYRSYAGLPAYFPGDGLNPQSAIFLDGFLHVICTGTNGGRVRYFGASEYKPVNPATGEAFEPGDEKPGTDPDDGIVLILDVSDRDNPSVLTALEIGGSPAGFRNAVDRSRKIVYLAGVGGIQSYGYGSGVSDFKVLHGSDSMIEAGSDPSSDYYSGLCYDEKESRLYYSFYSANKIGWLDTDGGVYKKGPEYGTGEGPGALLIREAE